MGSFDLGQAVRVTRVVSAGTPTAHSVSLELLESYHRRGYAVHVRPCEEPELDQPCLLEGEFSKSDGTRVSASVRLTPGVPNQGYRQTEVDVRLKGKVVVGGAKGMFASAPMVQRIAREKLEGYLDQVLAGVPPEPATPSAEATPAPAEATEPEAPEPEATEPGATEREATEPEATEREATEREATEPEATEPEATEPKPAAPVGEAASGGGAEAASRQREAEVARHDSEIARIEAEVLAAEAKLAEKQAEVAALEAEVAAEEAAEEAASAHGAPPQSTATDALDAEHEETLKRLEENMARLEAEIQEAEGEGPLDAVGAFGSAAAEAFVSATNDALALAEALVASGARVFGGQSEALTRETDLPPAEPLPPSAAPPAPEAFPNSERPPEPESIPAPEPIPAPGASDLEERLARVKDLFDKGLISEAEFRTKKTELLERFF